MNDDDHPSSILFHEVRERHPQVYDEILNTIKPHSIEAVRRVFKKHLESSNVDLNLFNVHRDSIPHFVLEYIKRIRKNFPTPGDASGIHSACRITRNDTQDILDSRHAKSVVYNDDSKIGRPLSTLEKAFSYELNLYKNQTRFLEITCKRKFSSIYVRDYSIDDFFTAFPFETCFLNPVTMEAMRGYPFKFSRFVVIQEPTEENGLRIFYHQHHSRDLSCLMKHFDFRKIQILNDLRLIFAKLGPTCYFHNAEKILNKYFRTDSRHHKDMIVALKIMIASGRLIGYNRNGLAKHPDRTVFEKLGFEAPKNIAVKLLTDKNSEISHPVESSVDHMFFGNTPKEGTGYSFTIRPEI